ncbi:uncharacterized protein FIBRA_05079 [Fibroporia radiculosa]|uniref:Uncharacterized protein n=1 Tax=Fibroporia radiculosa TaxID=599839 RepID=J4H3B1_9APHY|nr:uncharacterized protein FIBRA_05079 [Fibroporia radiculosa]CCM02964.1 predicted protein [Fibroporia radiculosa]
MSGSGPDAASNARIRSAAPVGTWKVSYRTISWAYPKKRPRSSPAKPVAGLHPRPPHYHDLLYRTRHKEWVAKVSPEDLELSSSLVGVRGAEQVLRLYEESVGIEHIPVAATSEPPSSGTLGEEDLPVSQERWNDQVQALLGGVLERLTMPLENITLSTPGRESKMWDLNLLDSPNSDVVDLTESELSVESDPLPSTPRAGLASPHSNKQLNASAMSFIPTIPTSSPSSSSGSGLRSPSPTYEFAFPSLIPNNPAASPPKLQLPLQKDGDGFYHPVTGASPYSQAADPALSRNAASRRASADLLPAFLSDGSGSVRARSRNTSKTREIVDRLRSGRWNGKKAGGRAGKESEDKSPAGPASQTVKSKEKSNDQGGCPAPTRAEAGSPDAVDGWVRGSESSLSNDDGWIAGLPSANPTTPARPTSKRAQKSGHKRSSSSTSSMTGSTSACSSTTFSPATSLSSFGPQTPQSASALMFPPPPTGVPLSPFSALYPPPPVDPVQMHIQQQMQAQQWRAYAAAIAMYHPPHPAMPYSSFMPLAVAGPPGAYPATKGMAGVQ